ncbi:phosphoribosyltransferase family protein [Sinomonas albida]|uniref:phosphoribosyltransferase family protein n=1 Tax=Sinomonas albida TaxID=369942 RepID=UPI00301B13DD
MASPQRDRHEAEHGGPPGAESPGPYASRGEAGRMLASALAGLPQLTHAAGGLGALSALTRAGRGGGSPLVVGLSRGGVAVAAEVARALGLAFDVVPARKLGIPGHEEVAFGAIASCDGERRAEVDSPLVRRLLASGFTEELLGGVRERESAELERQEHLYLAGRAQRAGGRTVIVCDDGAATGDTARAAIAAVRAAGASAVVVALPVAPPGVVRDIGRLADGIVCPRQPIAFRSVGAAYLTFPQCTDEEVLSLLAERGGALGQSASP